MPEDFRRRVVAVIAALAPGEVVSYGDVAAQAGFPGAARGVGAVLAAGGGDLPWWRVVTASGRLVPGREAEHAARLAAEGVALTHGRSSTDSRGGTDGPAAPAPGRARRRRSC